MNNPHRQSKEPSLESAHDSGIWNGVSASIAEIH